MVLLSLIKQLKKEILSIEILLLHLFAKVYHDEHVIEMLEKNPDYEKYGWRKNMCYATKQHREAIAVHGITEFHRKSFGICRDY